MSQGKGDKQSGEKEKGDEETRKIYIPFLLRIEDFKTKDRAAVKDLLTCVYITLQ